jgi:hypothetical protein
MCGTDDCEHALAFLRYFFGRFPSLDAATDHAD